MKTAEEIVNEGFKNWVIAGQIKRICQELINEARRECIDECAENAKVTDPHQDARRIGLRGNTIEAYMKSNPAQIDKQSILKLKDQLK